MTANAAATILLGLVVCALGQAVASSEEAATPKPPDEPQDAIMGVYLGTFTPTGGDSTRVEADVIGEGDGKYRAVLLLKGMDAKAPRTELAGKLDGGKAVLKGTVGDIEWTGAIADRRLTAESADGKVEARFAEKKPPTVGQKPPEGAVVLLPFEEGKAPSLDEWENKTWKALDDGSLLTGKGDAKSRKAFGSMKLHVEIRVPYLPKARGQGRGNSGVYLQDRYEIQVLDSFGQTPNKMEMGSVFDILYPIRYAALPPGTWQTYDIEFHTAKFDENGKKLRDANLTLVWNGVKVLDDEELAKTTGGAASGEAKEGPLRLQDHGSPVRFRNIWVVPLED